MRAFEHAKIVFYLINFIVFKREAIPKCRMLKEVKVTIQ